MNWHERIEAARERGGFTREDYKAAGSWITCACGQADPRIPRHPIDHHSYGAPKDKQLHQLGREFYIAVEHDAFDAAEHLLAEIEKRAGEVLAEASGV